MATLRSTRLNAPILFALGAINAWTVQEAGEYDSLSMAALCLCACAAGLSARAPQGGYCRGRVALALPFTLAPRLAVLPERSAHPSK